MNIIEGKGSGAESIAIEVRSALSLLPTNSSNTLISFDIGANIGNYTEALIDSGKIAEIYCFGPSTSAHLELNRRFSKLSNIHLMKYAIGNSEGSATLYTDSHASGLASMTKRRVEHFGIDFSKSEIIEVKTLTQVIRELGVVPDFIKIDVEGHELDVLRGGREILANVKLIQFEFGGANIDTRTYFQDFWYFFLENGFDIFRITKNGFEPVISYLEEDEYFKTTNYLARNRNQLHS